MKSIFFRTAITMSLLAVCFMTKSRLAAQDSPQQKLPSVDQIMDRAAEAVGGNEVNQKIKTFVMKGKIAIADRKIELVVTHASPTKQSTELSLAGVGSEETIVNGQLAWHVDSIAGSRMLTAAEHADAVAKAGEMADIFRDVGNWRTKYKVAAVVGESVVEGKAAYQVRLATKKNQVWIDHFDKKTGLLLKREVLEPAEGKVTQVYSDYRKVDGIMHAFTTKIKGAGPEVVATIDQIEQNVSIPEERFAVPAELRTQAAK